MQQKKINTSADHLEIYLAIRLCCFDNLTKSEEINLKRRY